MQDIWQTFLSNIKPIVGNQTIETWFKAVSINSIDTKKRSVYIETPNQFIKNWIKDHYLNIIQDNLKQILNIDSLKIYFVNKNKKKAGNVESEIIVSSDIKLPVKKEFVSESKKKLVLVKKSNWTFDSNLNELYSFKEFIVGPNNSLAHAASQAVCKNLGMVYNPLFIYGMSGLGKTHLLHAIGNEIKKNFPEKKILYQTTDKFITEFINSIKSDKVFYFRKKYEDIDLFLLDDIQFLSKKEQTQEVFFHIFNILYEKKKQLILSSDTSPKDIDDLQSRIKSRLEWGLVVDIQLPDLETRMAILQKKAERHNIILDSNVLYFIASNIKDSIRELEGALLRLSALSDLTDKTINIDLAKKIFVNRSRDNRFTKNRVDVILDRIFTIVTRKYSVTIDDLKSGKRNKNIVIARQVLIYFIKKLTGFSLRNIASIIGKKDHSTILYSILKIEKERDNNKIFDKKMSLLEQKILAIKNNKCFY